MRGSQAQEVSAPPSASTDDMRPGPGTRVPPPAPSSTTPPPEAPRTPAAPLSTPAERTPSALRVSSLVSCPGASGARRTAPSESDSESTEPDPGGSRVSPAAKASQRLPPAPALADRLQDLCKHRCADLATTRSPARLAARARSSPRAGRARRHAARVRYLCSVPAWLGAACRVSGGRRRPRIWAIALVWLRRRTAGSGRLLRREAVAQTIAGLDFLCVCDKVRIRGRAFSAAEDPLWPTELLSRGQRKQPLSNSYKGFGLCDGLSPKRLCAERRLRRQKRSQHDARFPARSTSHTSLGPILSEPESDRSRLRSDHRDDSLLLAA